MPGTRAAWCNKNKQTSSYSRSRNSCHNISAGRHGNGIGTQLRAALHSCVHDRWEFDFSIEFGQSTYNLSCCQYCEQVVYRVICVQYRRWLIITVFSSIISRASNVLLFQVDRRSLLRTSSSTRQGFELMTSRSRQYISCHWDACSNHPTISDYIIPASIISRAGRQPHLK